MTSRTREVDAPSVVVPDTSCLIALTALDQLQVLAELYPSCAVPPAVVEEYGPGLPPWIRLVQAQEMRLVAVLSDTLGRGEPEAIALASALPGSLVVLDDLRARRAARSVGLRLTGTLGVLLRAKREGRLTSLSNALEVMERTGFRLSADLRDSVLRLAGEGPRR